MIMIMMRIISFILFLANCGYIVISELLYYYTWSKDYALFIKQLSYKLSRINILYVKIFQAIALNHHFIDEHMNQALLQFTDNAPWTSSDINTSLLHSLSSKYNITIDPVPINSGMISIVFKGIIKNENETEHPVAIKIKRLHITTMLNTAIYNLQMCVYMVSWIKSISKYRLSESIENNIDMIRNQTNFVQEVANMQQMKENCKGLKYVVIPSVYTHACSDNVIVMEYIDGLKINDVLPTDYETFAKLIVKFGIVTTLVHGFAHGDLHSGNIFFIKSNNTYKIGIIDFGIVYSLNSKYKARIFDALMNLFIVEPRETAKKIIHSGIVEPEEMLETIPKQIYCHMLDSITHIIEDTIHTSKSTSQVNLYTLIAQLKDYLIFTNLFKWGLRLSDNCIKSNMVLAMSHGVTLKLCNNDNFIDVMDKSINELFNMSTLLQP